MTLRGLGAPRPTDITYQTRVRNAQCRAPITPPGPVRLFLERNPGGYRFTPEQMGQPRNPIFFRYGKPALKARYPPSWPHSG